MKSYLIEGDNPAGRDTCYGQCCSEGAVSAVNRNSDYLGPAIAENLMAKIGTSNNSLVWNSGSKN